MPSRFLPCINFVENIKQPVLSFGCKAASSRSTLTDWLCIRLSSRSLSPDLARSVAVEVSHIPRKSGVPRLALCPVPPVQCALASYLDVSRLFAIVLVAILQCSNPLFSLRPFDGNGPALAVEVRSRRDLPPYIILRRPAVRVAAWQGLSLPKAVTRRSLCPVTPLRYLLYHPS